MSIQEICRVAEHTQLGEGLYSMTLEAPGIAAAAQCGQFVHIACGAGNLLRRPISICTWQEGLVRLVYQVKGEGTKWLRTRRVGDALDVLGPLGHGFDIAALGAKPVLIGGGIGVPPMLACAQRAAGTGASPRAVLGFRSKAAVILEGDFRAVCPTFVTTDDGSYARGGFVTDVLRGLDYSYFYSCGPMPMFRAMEQVVKTSGQYSFEERMGCGFGACMGCSIQTKSGAKRVCKDGPVFIREEVFG